MNIFKKGEFFKNKRIKYLEEQIDKMIKNAKERNENMEYLEKKARIFQTKARNLKKENIKLQMEINEMKKGENLNDRQIDKGKKK